MDRFGDEGGTMTDPKTTTAAEASLPDTDPALEPSPEEIDAWAERERARRQAWLSGPSEDERADYAEHLRQRRLAEAFDEGEAMLQERMRQGLRYSREAQLATEGAISLFFRWSQHAFAELVKAGREWEEETNLPRIPRRVRMNDDKS
jgi:hypothetical protein